MPLSKEKVLPADGHSGNLGLERKLSPQASRDLESLMVIADGNGVCLMI